MKPAPISLFAQIVQLIPQEIVLECLGKYPEARTSNAKRYTRWDQLMALLFCQLGSCDSLREIEDGLYSAIGKLEHVAASPLKRTTLAYLNEKRDFRFFKDLYFRLLHRYEKALGGRIGKRFEYPVYSLDSTTITLCMKLFSWARYNHVKGGIKLHTAVNNDTLMPEVIAMTEARYTDVRQAKRVISQLPEFSVVVMDRGYNDYSLYYWLTERGTTFVTRLRDTAATTPLMHDQRGKGSNWGDYGFVFDNSKARELTHETPFRLVQWYDEESNRWFDFVTNNFELSAPDIAELYRERWQIELFFKKLKQNLKIKSFIGTTKNAVMSQVWTACICTLLVELLRRLSTFDWSFSRLMTFLRLNLLTHKPLLEWIHHPDVPNDFLRRRKRENDPPQMDLFAGGGPAFSIENSAV